jgi:glyoxylase-like metal-dependent hydrolase (beta-lactamase superfamily II)
VGKTFASSQDLKEQPTKVEELASSVFAYTAQGDPNTGFIAGEDGVMVIDARATPILAREFIAEIRQRTDRPFEHLVLTHYHAVRVLGASAFAARYIVAHRGTRELVAERGEQDFASELARFPRLFRNVESVPGLTWPTLTFDRELTLHYGECEVRLVYLGRGHTRGDAAVWLPRERVLFAGDLVEAGAALYCGDAYIEDWMETLERVRALGAEVLVPGRGPAVRGAAVREAIDTTQGFLRVLRDTVRNCLQHEQTLKQAYEKAHSALAPQYSQWPIFEHCMPFNVSRAYDELAGVRPRIWTAARDQEIWRQLTA